MVIHKYIHPITRWQMPASAGNKGQSLHRMMKLGLAVPKAYYCDWKAYLQFSGNDKKLLKHLEHELHGMIDPSVKYAVRSSANMEDSEDYSFAGQFDTVLNVQGIPAVLEAIQTVWASVRTPVVRAYLERHKISDTDLRMAVLIQEMAAPVFSGVALSKNPVTGADEIIIEAIAGEGSSLVQDGYTPHRWVNKWGYWLEKNDDAPIPMDLIQQIVDQVKDLAARVDFPIDTEWVYNGKTVYWVQMREITSIHKRNVYSNHMAKEMMPGMVKPLPFQVSSLISSRAILGWLSEMMGPIPLDPKILVKSFHYHAYFNMGALGTIFKSFGFPAESMEMLMGVLPPSAVKMHFKPSFKTFTMVPNALYFLLNRIGFRNRMLSDLEGMETRVYAAARENLETLNIPEILTRIERHFSTAQDVISHTSLSLFLLSMFNRVLSRQLKRRGIELSDFDLTENMPELETFYPSTHLEELNHLYRTYPPEIQNFIASTPYGQIIQKPELGDFTQKFTTLLEQFGHLGISGNDFSAPTWDETPDVLLKMVIDYQPLAHGLIHKTTLVDMKTRQKVDPLFLFFYSHAREMQYLRERSSFLYTHSKVMFRKYYLTLGRQLVQQGILDDPEDIFYLTRAQLDQICHGTAEGLDARAEIATHKHNMELCKDVHLPSVIYGDNPPTVCKSNARIMPGVSVCLGSYQGRTCVVRDENDFQKLKQGEVLVIPYSDVSWAPLFARAGALISESGGMLSHGSIVAREYNIPAIVSVDQATSLPDGILVIVDAHQGVVQLLEDPA